MVSWEYFKTIRKIKIAEWLVNRKINSYERLVSVLRDLGVKAPSKSVYESWLPKPVKKPTRKPAKPKTPKKTSTPPKVNSDKPEPLVKKTQRRRTTKRETSSPEKAG